MSVTPALWGRVSKCQLTHWLASLSATVRFWFIERPVKAKEHKAIEEDPQHIPLVSTGVQQGHIHSHMHVHEPSPTYMYTVPTKNTCTQEFK